MSQAAVCHTLPSYEHRNMTTTNSSVFTIKRNPYLAKWDILFDKKATEWISFKPQLGLFVYPCYACRNMFGSKNSFLDHVNRRGMLLKYKCSFCSNSDELLFYNPCSFLLHTRQHYTLLSGQINLEKLEVSVLPFGLGGFLPDPNIPMIYDVEDDTIEETLFINTRFYSPVQESMGQPIVNLVPNELLFLFAQERNTPSVSLVLKQVSSNIPRCQFVSLDSNRFTPVPVGLDINGKEIQNSENNNSLPLGEFQIKEEPQEINDENNYQYRGPIITKVETIDESDHETSHTNNFPHCPECGEEQTISMGEHFLKTNKPFQESLKCNICKYIAPTSCSLQAHERIHNSIAPYVCPECGKDFEDRELLHAHLEEVCFHLTKQVRMRCPGKKCGKIFAQTITFSAHFMGHMLCLNQCTICDDIFTTEMGFLEHAEEHNTKVFPIKTYKCSVCVDSSEIYTETNYQDHIYEHATNRKQCLYVYICKHCHSYFRSTTTYATHLLRCSKLASFVNPHLQSKRSSLVLSDAKQKPKSNILQIVGTCTACDMQVRVQITNFDSTSINCPNCNEPIHFSTAKKKNINTSLRQLPSLKESVLNKTDSSTRKSSCLLCQQELSSNETDKHFIHKTCKFTNPVVVLESRIDCSISTKSIKREIISPSSEDSSKNSSPKSDDSSKKKRKKSLSNLFNNKHRKLSSTNSETDIGLEPEEPTPFNGTYYCKLCNYSNTDRESFHKHIIDHRDVRTSYQCMECGECFVVKPTLVKHLLYFHQITDAQTYFNENDCFDKKAVKELEDTMKLAPGESKTPVAENQCRVCLEQFQDALELNKHFRTHGMAFLLKNTK